jgi:hypothetical protein
MENNYINPMPPKKDFSKWIAGGVVALTLLILALVVLKDGFQKNQPLPVQQSPQTPQSVEPSRPTEPVVTPTEPVPSPETGPKETVWVDVGWYQTAKNYACTGDKEIWKCMVVGKVKSGDFAGKEIVLAMEPGMGTIFHYFVLLDNKTFGQDLGDESTSPVAYKFYGIDDLPEYIDFPGSKYRLRKYFRNELFSQLKIRIKLFTHEKLGDFYLMDNGCIMVKLPDQTSIAYDLVLPFVSKQNGELDLTLENGTKNTEAYEYNAIVGCGALCYYLDTVDENVLKPQSRLKLAGKTSMGEEFFEFSDQQAQELKDLYNDKNTMAYVADGSYENTGKSKYTYEQFLSLKPLLYWKDPLGRWVKFQNMRFIPMAEMCKPVIYLYPPKPTELTVKVFPNGGFTYADPKYEDGWNVRANTDGTMVNLKDGKTYPYLFWEGVGLNYPITQDGWVVSKQEVEKFLQEKLPLLGLQGREADDFLDYWVKRLSEAPYYRINFLKQEQFNELAPLKFEGAMPESFIRVMMTAKPLEKNEESHPLAIPAPQARRGFVFVEWGGVVLK